jgi:hypothetical protein
MTRDELNDLMERRVVEDATEENESPHVFQFRGEHLNGIVVTPLAHEGDRDGTDPSEDAGIFTVEDREPGMRGPISFDPPTMQMLLQTASLVAIDSAALAPEIYNYFLDRVERGSRMTRGPQRQRSQTRQRRGARLMRTAGVGCRRGTLSRRIRHPRLSMSAGSRPAWPRNKSHHR